MSIVRKRLSPEESRSLALDAARGLLIESGPQAVTLKAVAARIGRTHANLLHHFGSALGLQQALARLMAERICATIAMAVQRVRAGEGSVREIVDLAFDAFDREGAGALASWMRLSGNEDALDPIIEAIHRLVHELAQDVPEGRVLHEDTLALVLLALGDALVGRPMAKALGLPRDTARTLAETLLARSVETWQLATGASPASSS